MGWNRVMMSDAQIVAFCSLGLSPGAFLLWAVLGTYPDGRGLGWVIPLPELATRLGVDERTIRRWAGELQRAGLLEVTSTPSDHGRGWNRWRRIDIEKRTDRSGRVPDRFVPPSGSIDPGPFGSIDPGLLRIDRSEGSETGEMEKEIGEGVPGHPCPVPSPSKGTPRVSHEFRAAMRDLIASHAKRAAEAATTIEDRDPARIAALLVELRDDPEVHEIAAIRRTMGVPPGEAITSSIADLAEGRELDERRRRARPAAAAAAVRAFADGAPRAVEAAVRYAAARDLVKTTRRQDRALAAAVAAEVARDYLRELGTPLLDQASLTTSASTSTSSGDAFDVDEITAARAAAVAAASSAASASR